MEKETLISSSTISWFTFVMSCRFKWASPRIKQVIFPTHHNSSNIDPKYQNANGASKWTFHPPAKGSKTRKSVQVDATQCSSVSSLFVQPCVGLQREITTRLVTYSTHTQKKQHLTAGTSEVDQEGGQRLSGLSCGMQWWDVVPMIASRSLSGDCVSNWCVDVCEYCSEGKNTHALSIYTRDWHILQITC